MTIRKTARFTVRADPDADAERAHATSDAVKVFTDTLYPMCTEPPVFDAWEAVE